MTAHKQILFTPTCQKHSTQCHTRWYQGTLKNGRFNGKLLSWFSDYLSNRYQRVLVDCIFSRLTRISSGVPQCSILGQLLFHVYINDLQDSLNECKSLPFADDAKIFCKVPSHQFFWRNFLHSKHALNRPLSSSKVILTSMSMILITYTPQSPVTCFLSSRLTFLETQINSLHLQKHGMSYYPVQQMNF